MRYEMNLSKNLIMRPLRTDNDPYPYSFQLRSLSTKNQTYCRILILYTIIPCIYSIFINIISLNTQDLLIANVNKEECMIFYRHSHTMT